jgi:hypothetical protein
MAGTINDNDSAAPRYPYFEYTEPLVFDEPGTWVAVDRPIEHGVTHSWSHSLGRSSRPRRTTA